MDRVKEGGDCSPTRVPTRLRRGLRLGGEHRRGSGASRGWLTGGRGLARHGDLKGVVFDVDRILLQGGGAARGSAETGGSSCGCSCRFAMKSDKPRVSQCAPERGKEDRREERGSGSPWSSESSGDARRCINSDEELPRAGGISGGENKREAREEFWGFLYWRVSWGRG
jgi:hypothetical protein